MPKTKIICTLGPASGNAPVIRKMAVAGMDVARLNFSHGTLAEHENKINLLRSFNKKYRRHIKILQDLEGPRIRVGELVGHKPVELKKRQVVQLTTENIKGNSSLIPIDYKGSLSAVKKNYLIFIDDGNMALEVTKSGLKRLTAKVVVPGILKEHKGINIPEAKLKFPRLSENDRKNIEFGIAYGVDYIAQSFVRSKKDILPIRELLKDHNVKCLIIAKIENRDGIKNLDEILDVCDGIMVARGDLGVSVPIYEVPILQKQIINKCRKRNKFVITATQMLESMVHNKRPTRAEVSDVANSIIDGTDFVMLSAETAVGEFPDETVNMMNHIIIFTEKSINSTGKII